MDAILDTLCYIFEGVNTQYITKDDDGSYIYHNGVQQKNYEDKTEAVSHYLHTKDL
ncbi:MAG: hypothetical protein K6F57_00715 [Candidatus Saccharibacteria bacterium]|nr:hypothetical protein [Candidatus Saccharibacteria bacterium]